VDNSPNDGFAESYARLRRAKNASLCDVLFVRPAKLAEKEAAPPPSLRGAHDCRRNRSFDFRAYNAEKNQEIRQMRQADITFDQAHAMADSHQENCIRTAQLLR
jgi:hypothetical protein